MRKHKFAVLAALAVLAAGAYAQSTQKKAEVAKAAAPAADAATEAEVKRIIEPRLGDGVKVDSVRLTPYSGLYEVRTNGDIIYTDRKGEFLFVGNILNSKTYENYTKARVDEINKIKFSDLPLDLAMKVVKGDGKRVMAIFEDPNCGYCKRFRQTTLKEIDNVTIYTFLYNILSEDSSVKSKNIWCSPDKVKALDDWMIENKQPPAAPANCANPNEKVAELGRKLRINGTPAIFFADGSRIPGAIDARMLEQKLSSIKQ
ncbi:DsbC family protein [Massilia sp. W12]|uniref:DsbC family protein n=1 Tax=Massilia sp. W12 TaxID=3126507 RepID=UPI0030CA6F1C